MPNATGGVPPRPARAEPPRRCGRLLVEVLIAMVLLVVGASATVALVRANFALSERVAFLRSTRAVTRQVGEALSVSPCAAAAGAARHGGTEIVWTPSVSGPLVALSVEAWSAAPPSTRAAPHPLTAKLAGWCP